MSEEEKYEIEKGDDLEKAIDRYTIEGWDMGLDDDEDYIPVTILKQILDHFIPKWRRHEDKYYKLKKFVTEQQMDSNLSKIRECMEKKYREIMDEIIRTREFMDEFKAQAAEVHRLIEADRIAVERIRLRKNKERE